MLNMVSAEFPAAGTTIIGVRERWSVSSWRFHACNVSDIINSKCKKFNVCMCVCACSGVLEIYGSYSCEAEGVARGQATV